VETVYYAYALDSQQRLLGVVSLRELFQAQPSKLVRDVMRTELITVHEEMDQEAVSRLFSSHNLAAIPVVDSQGRMKGIVTIDDIVDVVEEEATEDIQKVGGMEALEAPYLETKLGSMIKKRVGWLTVLFLGELLTASAMAFFEDEIAKAVMLALFVPLIVSSGGNSGSQASTLIIRAMALGEIQFRDVPRVLKREIASGLALGLTLGVLGFSRIVIWHWIADAYGDHYVLIGLTVGFSLIGVVLAGTLFGSMLPFALRKLGADPASASAPFVATLVDVVGLLMYFGTAVALLSGTLL
jgi:magnesium transporter